MKNLLKQSWQIVRHNPILWLFGFFSAFLWTNEVNLLINNTKFFSNNLNILLSSKILSQTIFNLDTFKKLIGHLELANFIFIFLPILVLFILALIAQICLIKGIQDAADGQKIIFSQSLKTVRSVFWLVFLLNIFSLAIIYLLFMILRLPFAYLFLKFSQTIWLIIYLILSLILLIPGSLVISFVTRFAIIDLITQPKNLWLSLKNAFSFFIHQWLKIIWLAIILIGIGFVFGLILFILITTASFPFLILSNFFYYLKIPLGSWLMFSLGLLLLILLVCFLGSIFSAFQIAVWVLFFQQGCGKEVSKMSSKIC
ncbi:MAG: hypothetical protein ACP5IX_00680 [Patescibacteria group bacterium]